MRDERQEQALSRADFPDAEAWALYLHQSGLEAGDKENVAGPGWDHVAGDGPAASLYRAIHGHTERQHAHAWAGWGETTGVRADQFMKLYRAVAFANYRGWVLNTFVSVTWSTVGVTGDVAVAAATKTFLDLCRRHLKGHGVDPAFIWVVERGSTFGLHLHLLLHLPVPYGHAFRNWLPKGFRSATGMKPVAIPGVNGGKGVKTLDLQVPGKGETERAQVADQWRRFLYMMKGLERGMVVPDPEDRRAKLPAAKALGLVAGDEGLVASKRVGVSKALGTATQAAQAAATGRRPILVAQDLAPQTPDYSDEYLRQGKRVRLMQSLDI